MIYDVNDDSVVMKLRVEKVDYVTVDGVRHDAVFYADTEAGFVRKHIQEDGRWMVHADTEELVVETVHGKVEVVLKEGANEASQNVHTPKLHVKKLRVKEVQGYFYPQVREGHETDADFKNITGDNMVPMKFSDLKMAQKFVKSIYESWHAVAEEQIRVLQNAQAQYNADYLEFVKTEVTRVH